MKSNLLRTFFEWALIASLLMSIGFFGLFYFKSKSARIYETQVANAQLGIQNNHTVLGVLLTECQEYAKTNADMARLLDSLRAQSVVGPAPTLATKPKPAK